MVVGCLCGIATWLGTASTFEGGLGDFINNTGNEVSMLVGNCVSIGVGGLVCIFVSLATNRDSTEELQIEWEKTRNIDNPLKPWTTIYAEDFGRFLVLIIHPFDPTVVICCLIWLFDMAVHINISHIKQFFSKL